MLLRLPVLALIALSVATSARAGTIFVAFIGAVVLIFILRLIRRA